MSIEAKLIINAQHRDDIKVECDMKRNHCTGMLTEINGNKITLPENSKKQIKLKDGKLLDIIVGNTKYYDTLVFVSEPTKVNI